MGGKESVFTRGIAQGPGHDLDFRMPSDEDVRWLEERGEVVRDVGDEPLSVIGASTGVPRNDREGERWTAPCDEQQTRMAPISGSVHVPEAWSFGGGAHARRRVLIVEHEIDAARSLREALQLGGHAVAIAYNEYDGIAQARMFRPDIVFCDLRLPGTQGATFARAMRAAQDLRDIALFAVSGDAQRTDADEARKAGFDGHLSLPQSVMTAFASTTGPAQF